MRTHRNPDVIDLATVGSALKRSMPKILLAGLVAAGLAYATLSVMAAKYASEAQLMIGGKGLTDPFRDPKGGMESSDSVMIRVDREAVASQVLALRSEDLARKVAAELKLASRAEFNSAVGPEDVLGSIGRMLGLGGPRSGETDEDRVLAAYRRALQVHQGKDTRVISIEFTSSDPQLAADAANKLAELYQAWLRSQGVSTTTDASDRLRPQIDKLAAEVAAAEAEMERFRASAGLLTSGKESQTLNQQQLAEISSELTKAKAQRSEAEARARAARDLMQRGGAEASPDVQRSPNIQAIVQQRGRIERQLGELSATLLPAHPRMQQLKAELAALKRQLTTEIDRMVDGLEREAKVASLREDAVKQRLDELSARAVATGGDEVKLKEIESQARVKRAQLESLRATFEAARSRAEAQAVPLEAQILQQARPSSVPIFPKKGPMALLTLAASLLLGLVAVIARETMPDRRNAPQLAGMKVPVRSGRRAGDLPALNAGLPVPKAMSAPEVADGQVLNGFAKLTSLPQVARNLIRGAGGAGGHRCLIVPERDETGHWDDALELAKTVATMGRTAILVCFCHAGRPAPGCAGVELLPGLSELADGTATFDAVVQRMPGTSAHVIAGGNGFAGAEAGALDIDRINLILDALDEAYDNIIVTADRTAGRHLFEAIQGRFDAAIMVRDGGRRAAVGDTGPGRFLGFDVIEMDIISYERPGQAMRLPRSLRLAAADSAA